MTLPHEFLYELHKHFTGDIRTDSASKILYSTDASIYQIEPLGVVLPRTQDDLIAAVEVAAKYKIPILPRGSGSSLAGQAIGPALILDCSRWLNQIIEIDPESQSAVVEPGAVLASLNTATSKYGLMFGPDPASAERATMGGVIANNATGAHSIIYGMSADHLISADVILADGSLEVWEEDGSSKLTPLVHDIRDHHATAIRRNYPRAWRNSAGYRLNYLLPWSPSMPPQWSGEYYPANLKPGSWNLAHLLAGSEGTLAVMRRIRVNLVPKPNQTVLGVLAYASIAEACDDVPRLLEFHPSAIELIPQLILRLARTVPASAHQMSWIAGEPAAILVVEFSGDQIQPLLHWVRQIREDVVVAETRAQQNQIWNIRKVGLGILDSRYQTDRPIAFIEDCAIPVERLGDFVREVEKILAAHHTYGGIYAHASGGCLHIRPMLDLRSSDGVAAMRAIADATLSLTLTLGGSMSSEHGDGLARSEWLQQIYGEDVVAAMYKVKQAADPHNLLNPGKLFDAPQMDSHLRYGNEYHVQSWHPALDFLRDGNLTLAIEQCNGQGVCRKDSGVMCPSYQATREEMYSTRGRANLLRALINRPWTVGSGRSAVDGLSSLSRERVEAASIEHVVVQALDLCLACKGCKAECPSGVDMAKLKYEFENRYYKTHRRPWRDYVFGYFHQFAKLAAWSASLTNVLMQNKQSKHVAARMLKITYQRPLPRFIKQKSKITEPLTPSLGRVLFLSDPFARYIDPDVEQATIDVLTMCGYKVQVLSVIGAGASLLSKGFIDAAKKYAQSMLDELQKVDPKGEVVIVGIEPPEIYTLKHDYIDLLPEKKDDLASLSNRAWLLDEFLIRAEGFDAILKSHLQSKQPSAQVKFQPHCHQRAEGPAADGLPSGVNATLGVLRACNFDVELINAGCCGMAGTFGYESEHYDLSMQIGELKLFPFLRRIKQESNELPLSVVSTGAACRMQIAQGAETTAVHPVLLVWDYLKGIINSTPSS